MEIHVATTDAEILACHAVMRELRPHIDEAAFVEHIRILEQSGYRLAWLQQGERPMAVAGFRLGESLAWGRYLYVDDLTTASSHRSRGFGTALLTWLAGYAQAQGCCQLHLDCGIQREDARRFYEDAGLQLTGYHFVRQIVV